MSSVISSIKQDWKRLEKRNEATLKKGLQQQDASQSKGEDSKKNIELQLRNAAKDIYVALSKQHVLNSDELQAIASKELGSA